MEQNQPVVWFVESLECNCAKYLWIPESMQTLWLPVKRLTWDASWVRFHSRVQFTTFQRDRALHVRELVGNIKTSHCNCMFVLTCVCARVCIYVYIYTDAYTYFHICHLCVCILCVHMISHKILYTKIHTYSVYLCVHVCMYVCMYVCLFVCVYV